VGGPYYLHSLCIIRAWFWCLVFDCLYWRKFLRCSLSSGKFSVRTYICWRGEVFEIGFLEALDCWGVLFLRGVLGVPAARGGNSVFDWRDKVCVLPRLSILFVELESPQLTLLFTKGCCRRISVSTMTRDPVEDSDSVVVTVPSPPLVFLSVACTLVSMVVSSLWSALVLEFSKRVFP